MQREITLTEEQAKEFYKEHEGAKHFPCLIKHMTRSLKKTLKKNELKKKTVMGKCRVYMCKKTALLCSGPVLALALTREDAVQRWRNLLGPKILQEAKEKYPER